MFVVFQIVTQFLNLLLPKTVVYLNIAWTASHVRFKIICLSRSNVKLFVGKAETKQNIQ